MATIYLLAGFLGVGRFGPDGIRFALEQKTDPATTKPTGLEVNIKDSYLDTSCVVGYTLSEGSGFNVGDGGAQVSFNNTCTQRKCLSRAWVGSFKVVA